MSPEDADEPDQILLGRPAARVGARLGASRGVRRSHQGIRGAVRSTAFPPGRRSGAAIDLWRSVRERLAYLLARHETHRRKLPAGIRQHGLAGTGKPALAQARVPRRHLEPEAPDPGVAGTAQA